MHVSLGNALFYFTGAIFIKIKCIFLNSWCHLDGCKISTIFDLLICYYLISCQVKLQSSINTIQIFLLFFFLPGSCQIINLPVWER